MQIVARFIILICLFRETRGKSNNVLGFPRVNIVAVTKTFYQNWDEDAYREYLKLFSTHITSDIEKCADDIMYIRNGKIVADCSQNEFFHNYCKD